MLAFSRLVTFLWLLSLLLVGPASAVTTIAQNCTFAGTSWDCIFPGNTTITFNDPIVGPFNLSSSVVYSGTTVTDYNSCIVNNCMNWNLWCGCSSSIGSSQCSLGQFYTLRNGPAFFFSSPTALFCSGSKSTEFCADTSWLPSSPYLCLDIANTYSLINNVPNLVYFQYINPSIINYTLATMNGTFASDGTGLYNISGPYNTFNAGFSLTSPSLTAALPGSANCSTTDVGSFVMPKTGTICPVFNKTRVTPKTTNSYIKFTLTPFNNWFYQRMTIYGNVITLSVCLTNCYVQQPGQQAILVGPNYVQYGSISPTGFYNCEATNCFTINCCLNPVAALATNPCSPSIGGTVSCVNQVVYFNETLSNWTFVDPTNSYFCDVDTGACFPAIDVSYSWNPLSLILLSILIVLGIVLVVALIYLMCRATNQMGMM